MRKVITLIVLMCLMGVSPFEASAATLSALTIDGSTSIEGGKSVTYTAKASYSNGSTAVVTPSLWYVTPPTYASISTSGVLTTSVVTAQQTISVYASYTEGGLTQSKLISVTITPAATTSKSLTGLSISGPSSVEGGESETYTAKASYSNGSTAEVKPSLWYVTPPTYVSISTSGVLTTKAVTSQQTVTVYASYTEGGATQSKTLSVTLKPSASSNSCTSGGLYSTTLPDGSTGSVCMSMKKVATPSGESKLRGTATWTSFATTAASAKGSTFTFAWENYESDSVTGTLHENHPAHGALFVLAYAFPSSTCGGGASFFAVIEMSSAVSMKDLGASMTFTPLFGQICGTSITSLTSYTLTKQ